MASLQTQTHEDGSTYYIALAEVLMCANALNRSTGRGLLFAYSRTKIFRKFTLISSLTVDADSIC